MDERKYPEHEKLKNVKDYSQAIHDFLEWLSYRPTGIHLYYLMPGSDQFLSADRYVQVGNHRDLLAEFYEIDQDVLEAEKRDMLDRLRTQHSVDDRIKMLNEDLGGGR